jgi:hypothetical protein
LLGVEFSASSFVKGNVTSIRTNWFARLGAGIARSAPPPICRRTRGRNRNIVRIIVLPE